jgi:hypothetical protein
MPVSPQGVAQVPNYWTVFGHSYFQNAFGTRTQAGRADALFRNLLNVDHTSYANLAVTGSRLTFEGQAQGGYARLYNNVVGFEVPATQAGGARRRARVGFADASPPQAPRLTAEHAAYYHALRVAISRCRDVKFAIPPRAPLTRNRYAAVHCPETQRYASNNTVRICTTTYCQRDDHDHAAVGLQRRRRDPVVHHQRGRQRRRRHVPQPHAGR